MPNIDFATSESMQKASDLLEKLLQQQDYFNSEKMDEIQISTIGQADFFEVDAWQDLLKNQKDVGIYFTHFLNFYLEYYQEISDRYQKQSQIQMQKAQTYFQENSHFLEQQNFDLTASSWQDAPFYSDAQEIQNLNQLMYLNYWLQAFTPFAEQNVPLVWQGFQAFPFEIFPFVVQISAQNLNPQDIEYFYDLFTAQKLDFATEGSRPTDYIQHFYDLFPALLLDIPKRFAQTESIHLKKKLLICLAHRKSPLALELQAFILQQFIFYSESSPQPIFYCCLNALGQCKNITIPEHIILQLKTLLHHDEVWYVPMDSMMTLNQLGVREPWFKQHLLDALDDPYGCDDLTPQGTSIEILTSWGTEGLYTTDKITQLLQQAIQQEDQESIANLTIYMDAYPQLATYFQSILWQWMVHLSTLPEDECWIEGKTLKTFLQLSVWIKWQPIRCNGRS
ncbi:hypothetical protein [Acinetobacter defluvii]|uniref:hypothetical protein n=1 Tax=Acinetobacter defluvii TaxID=1871111 RepID=UPI003AF862B0